MARDELIDKLNQRIAELKVKLTIPANCPTEIARGRIQGNIGALEWAVRVIKGIE